MADLWFRFRFAAALKLVWLAHWIAPEEAKPYFVTAVITAYDEARLHEEFPAHPTQEKTDA